MNKQETIKQLQSSLEEGKHYHIFNNKDPKLKTKTLIIQEVQEGFIPKSAPFGMPNTAGTNLLEDATTGEVNPTPTTDM